MSVASIEFLMADQIARKVFTSIAENSRMQYRKLRSVEEDESKLDESLRKLKGENLVEEAEDLWLHDFSSFYLTPAGHEVKSKLRKLST